MKRIITITLFLMIGLYSYALTGEEVMEKYIDTMDTSLRGTAEVVFLDNNGKVTGSRFAEQFRYKDKGGIRKKAVVLHKPANARGTRFLTIENKDRKDDVWVYTPELRQVRRMETADKSKGFLGSPDGTYTYEDLELEAVEDFNIKLLRQETVSVDNVECYLLELVKKDQSDTQYGKIHLWIVKDKYIQKKREFFDKDGKKFKVQEYTGLMKIPGGWAFKIMKIENLNTGWATAFKVINMAMGEAARIEKGIFTTNYLETGVIR